MKLYFIPVVLIAGVLPAGAQSQFCKSAGGANDDHAYAIIQTTDGGYLMAGSTNSFGAGNTDAYIVKLDASGTLNWTKTIGGTNSDNARSIVQTADGGYVIAGYTESFGAGNIDMYIVKLDAAGTVSWTRTVGGSNSDYAHSIVQTTDGGYAVAGVTESFGAGSADVYVVKLDAGGTVSWAKSIGGSSIDYGNSIVQTTDGGYAIAGATESFGAGGYDTYAVKLDASGAVSWTRTIGGNNIDYGNSIVHTADGGYALGGYTESFGTGLKDMYLVKLDAGGTVSWTSTVGGTADDWASCLIKTADGGYALAGHTESFGTGISDAYVTKLNANGIIQWGSTFGNGINDYVRSIVQAADGGYAVAGATISMPAISLHMYVAKLDASGNSCCKTASGGSNGTGSNSGSGGTASTGGTGNTGGTSGAGGTVNNICTNVSTEEFFETMDIAVYPNPTSGQCNLVIGNGTKQYQIEIYNTLGERVCSLMPDRQSITLDISEKPRGIYFVKAIAEDGHQAIQKIVLQ